MSNKIPKIIHHIWVGEKEMPTKWMQTWRDKHSGWEFMLWDNKMVKEHTFRNEKKITQCMDSGLMHGAADIIRYEILYEFGGFVAPADSVCLLPIDELLDIEEDCFCCYEHETKRPGLLSPQLGTSVGNELMREMIDRIPSDIVQPWIQTGNQLLTNTVSELKYPIKIYPSVFFIPVYNDGTVQKGKAYADHKWGTTKGLYKEGRSISAVMTKKRERFVGERVKLSVFSIVKNEHEMCRGAWDSVKDADELVVVDTGSTDDTVDIAKTYTDEVHFFEWIDDFAAAKNYAMSKCSGDWVVCLDADWRLEKGGIEKIREAIDEYGDAHDVINVTLVSIDSPGNIHLLPNIIKNNGSVEYSGAIHEVPTKLGYGPGDVTINYRYSPSHKADPNRNIRILKKELEKKPNSARSMFYLAREYYYKKDYEAAFDLFSKYIGISKYRAEKGDAYLLSAKCLFQLQRGNEAREHCLRAIEINPDHEEALRFMADIHYEPWKHKWLQFADLAENKGVLFVVKRG